VAFVAALDQHWAHLLLEQLEAGRSEVGRGATLRAAPKEQWPMTNDHVAQPSRLRVPARLAARKECNVANTGRDPVNRRRDACATGSCEVG